jgi:hypothetical protein
VLDSLLLRNVPGEIGIKSVLDEGSGYQDVVGDGFHIIGFDPRGVGLTTPYTCPEATGDVGMYNTDAGLAAAFQYNTAQAKDCADSKFGSHLIGTAFVARDIKAIAEAIGESHQVLGLLLWHFVGCNSLGHLSRQGGSCHFGRQYQSYRLLPRPVCQQLDPVGEFTDIKH